MTSLAPRIIAYRDASGEHQAAWWSGEPPPLRVAAVSDATGAAAALRRLAAGEWLLYDGDYHNARQLLAAAGRRLARARRGREPRDLAAAFRAGRARRLEEHLVLSRLLVPLSPDLRVALRRGPDLSAPVREAFAEGPGLPGLAPLRELLGMIGAHEWRKRGVEVRALSGRIHPHYAVFAPIRQEYVDLVAVALDEHPPAGRTAFDVGTGTGVLAILLARHGAARVVATDRDPRAVACASENAGRFGVLDRVEVVLADLFPPGRAALVLANPPWVPEEPHGALDRAVYDPGGAVLARLVQGLREHLEPGGEAWLVLSDLAERLGLRPPGHLAAALAAAGLEVRWKRAARPAHPRARDAGDPLHAARSGETTWLYCLVASGRGGAEGVASERSTAATGLLGTVRTGSP